MYSDISELSDGDQYFSSTDDEADEFSIQRREEPVISAQHGTYIIIKWTIIHPAVLCPESLVCEYYSVIGVMRDKFKAKILKKRMNLLKVQEEEGLEDATTEFTVIQTSPGITQRQAWVEAGKSYPS